jgi:hypothetical protein
LERWAVGLAAAVAIGVVVSYAIFFAVPATGGTLGDNWVWYLGGVSLVGGLVVSLVAFALAIVAKVKHERWRLPWLPLSVFPALLVIVVMPKRSSWSSRHGPFERSPTDGPSGRPSSPVADWRHG